MSEASNAYRMAQPISHVVGTPQIMPQCRSLARDWKTDPTGIAETFSMGQAWEKAILSPIMGFALFMDCLKLLGVEERCSDSLH